MDTMSTQQSPSLDAPMAPHRHLSPQAFAEQLISRESLERSDLNDPNCLAIRNVSTGETLVVDSVQMERWLNAPV